MLSVTDVPSLFDLRIDAMFESVFEMSNYPDVELEYTDDVVAYSRQWC